MAQHWDDLFLFLDLLFFQYGALVLAEMPSPFCLLIYLFIYFLHWKQESAPFHSLVCVSINLQNASLFLNSKKFLTHSGMIWCHFDLLIRMCCSAALVVYEQDQNTVSCSYELQEIWFNINNSVCVCWKRRAGASKILSCCPEYGQIHAMHIPIQFTCRCMHTHVKVHVLQRHSFIIIWF